jgi:hypothetical protein
MANNTFSVLGGAMPKIDRATVMRRAWAIFCQTYKYPRIKFSDIGRKCFGWALKAAWSEARDEARIAAISPAARAERIEVIHSLLERANYIDSGPQWKAAVLAYRQEIRQLQALA